MEDHDFTDIETLAGLYDCVRDLVAERDRLRAVVEDLPDRVAAIVADALLELVGEVLEGSEATDSDDMGEVGGGAP